MNSMSERLADGTSDYAIVEHRKKAKLALTIERRWS
jgi:hypothetical protein